MLNFTIQDLFGVSLACLVFPVVLLFPGYIVGWVVNLFDFKQRQILTRHIIALLISIAIVPILFYQLAFFISFSAVAWIIVFFFAFYVVIMVLEIWKANKQWQIKTTNHYQKFAFWIAIGWVVFTILSLADLQWGDRLYNNVVSYDSATRATVINAISRTGVPPVNPSYFPGRPEYITSLYYFWYILCSVIDQLGGDLIDARMALIAGDVWVGLALMALIALYIKIRNQTTGISTWKKAVIGVSLLAISGLDIIPALTNMLATKWIAGFIWPFGDIEHWNEQITAWVGSLLWVPHHVTAMIACMVGFIIFQYHRESSLAKSISIAPLAGMAFASAVGLSTWVTITFSIFLGIWVCILLLQKKNRNLTILIILAGIIALLVASPFLIGILKAGTGASGSPIVMGVRRFLPLTPYLEGLSINSKNLAYLVFLPVNYLTELGFFFVIGWVWLQRYRKKDMQANPFFIPEIVLLSVVFLVCSFVRSAIVANDLGWRGWLLGQFILLIWAVDLYDVFPFSPRLDRRGISEPYMPKTKNTNLLALLWLIGLSTSVVNVLLLRSWPLLVDANISGFPNGLSLDTHLGERTFDGRLAYEFIDDKLPADVIIQQNPLSKIDKIDRSSGLYSNRQFAISFNAPYNVPLPILNMNSNGISKIFALAFEDSWDKIDQFCRTYFIDVLVVSDQDPLWKGLPLLYQQRAAFYENRYYAVIPCGNFVLQ